jgi:hypothetical protein
MIGFIRELDNRSRDVGRQFIPLRNVAFQGAGPLQLCVFVAEAKL